MIQLEPNEPTNYFALAKIYEDAGAYEEAEQMLLKAKEAKPNDPAVYMQLAGYYNRQGAVRQDDRRARAARGQGAEQPRGVLHHRDLLLGRGVARLPADGRPRRRTTSEGSRAINKALQIKPDYIGGARLQGLLLRLAGQHREGSGQAAGADQGSRSAARQGEELRKRRQPAPGLSRTAALRTFGFHEAAGFPAAFFCVRLAGLSHCCR